jgi:hypothetical protein
LAIDNDQRFFLSFAQQAGLKSLDPFHGSPNIQIVPQSRGSVSSISP